MHKLHSFHIPVMGIGFTIDSPLKVAQFGIDSVVSLVDDILIEKMRKFYSEKFKLPYKEITDKVEDFRAKRITAYLDLLKEQTDEAFNKLKNISSTKCAMLKEYVDILPEYSTIKKEYNRLIDSKVSTKELKNWVSNNLKKGSIDVNIMTKVDKGNYKNKQLLPSIYNDAHAALRGFSNSKLTSSLVLSAGLNPKLYTYISNFDDFFPDVNGYFKKNIILKVSDYRSAFVQGKFLAKKGIWVSEYRIESGLNCGGHAFATDGFLLGPVLKEFKENREVLKCEIQTLLKETLKNENRVVPNVNLPLKITTQGGVGTGEEHDFLLKEYDLDSVGWGSPFLLVPEATSVDKTTMDKLVKAKESDLYLSNTSPLGIPFNTLKGNTKDEEKEVFIKKGRPGTSCPNKFIQLNKEFEDSGLCVASRTYQHLKLKELENKDLSILEKEEKFKQITEKSCICVGLGTSTLLLNNISTKKVGKGVSVCPGPNMAYYNSIMSLKDIINHIYKRGNVLSTYNRPHFLIKELSLYVTYLKEKIGELKVYDKKKINHLSKFKANLENGISYYNELFERNKRLFADSKSYFIHSLQKERKRLSLISLKLEKEYC